MANHVCRQEVRISNLEIQTSLADNNILHLVHRLDELTKILTTIAVLLFGAIITSLGFLISFWVKGGF